MINTPNLEQAKRLIKKENKPIIVKAQNLEFNRKILEYGKFDIIFSIEDTKGEDNPKKLNSGLNHIMAKIAAKNKIVIGMNISEIQKLGKKEKAVKLARIRQNIKICRKAKTIIKVLNYKDRRNAFSFLLSLGASTEQAKEAIKQL